MPDNYDEAPIHVDDVTQLTPLFPELTEEEEVKLVSALMARNESYNSSTFGPIEEWIESVVTRQPRLFVL